VDWRELLREKDPELYLILSQLVNEIKKYKEVYSKAKNPALAQIWIALAIIYKKIYEKKENNEDNLDEIIDELAEKL